MPSEPVVDIRSMACATSIREILSVDFRLALVIVSDFYITGIPSVDIDSLLQLAIPSLFTSPAATTAPRFHT